MKKILSFLLCSLAFYATLLASGDRRIHIIPEPVSVAELQGSFVLDKNVVITVSPNDQSLLQTVLLFTNQVAASTGITLSIKTEKGSTGKTIRIENTNADNKDIGTEGYLLEVSLNEIILSANENAGIFHGLQTLLQLLPPGIENKQLATGVKWEIPCVKIIDYPRFGWRGLLLDVSRHFFTKEEVKQYIDEMVKYKYNTLHLHLSDDNGWRLEIKSLPELTKTGAWRVPRTGRFWYLPPPQPGEAATDGGFYTQDDMREIIQYAQQRFVTILPEIDVPAHSLSLIASYPGLSCTQLQYQVDPGSNFWGKKDNVLCVGNDSIYLMLDKIFTEIAHLFPNNYIHIGGDEANKDFWGKCPKCKKRMADEHLNSLEELQSYFVKRVEKIVNTKGKQLIGWDEILEGGLAPTAAVMSWRGMKGGIEAAKMNHHVVMTPWNYAYIDLYQGDPSVEPPTYGMCRLSASYNWDPVPDSVDAKYILGGQGNLWSEQVPNFRHAEYMTWPRALALSEVFWSPKDKRNWDDFTIRMEEHFKRFNAANVKYSRSAYDAILTPHKAGNKDSLVVALTTEIKGIDIYYRFDTTDPDDFSPKYNGEPLTFPIGADEIKVVTYRDSKPLGRQINVKLSELKERLKYQPDY